MGGVTCGHCRDEELIIRHKQSLSQRQRQPEDRRGSTQNQLEGQDTTPAQDRRVLHKTANARSPG